jgi:hypothetical protein
MRVLLGEWDVKAVGRGNLSPLRGWGIFVVYPVLMHWAKVCRASGALD